MKGTQMNIVLKTLTPLWTGGADGATDCLHETGIIGSLRWWYEVIVRGLGGWACDPSRHECPDNNGQVCDACAVFGSTGRKCLFRIDWERPENSAKQAQLQVKVNSNREWFLRRGLLLNNMAGRFVPVRQPKDISFEELQQILALTLCLIADWGGLGAKTQQGYGVVCLKEIKPPFDLEKEKNAKEKSAKNR
jgi:CRISPR-associated protein Cmr1